MGVKGSKAALSSRFRASDFFFGESASLGLSAPATVVEIADTPAWPGEEESSNVKPGIRRPHRLVAVGCEDGSVHVFGGEGVHVRLYEEPPDEGEDNDVDDEDENEEDESDNEDNAEQKASKEATTASSPSSPSSLSNTPAQPSPAVLFLAFLPERAQLVSVHAGFIKIWSLESMMISHVVDASDIPLSDGAKARREKEPAAGRTSSPGLSASVGYTLTSAALSTELNARFLWIGTREGDVLMFDTARRRMCSYIVSLQQEVLAHAATASAAAASASASASTSNSNPSTPPLPPTAITCLAQLPSDHSQLLIGFQCDMVLTWHISSRRLHRTYKRSGCGGVTSCCWERDEVTKLSEHFVVGHGNGLIVVWRRKYAHAPQAQFFLSNVPSSLRAPIHRIRWSLPGRGRGFFVCGGQALKDFDDACGVESGSIVFIPAGQHNKFEQRKVCGPREGIRLESERSRVGTLGNERSVREGIRDFVQVILQHPINGPSTSVNSPTSKLASGSAAAATATPPQPSIASTPAFIAILPTGSITVLFPTIVPPVPALPVSDVGESTFHRIQLLTPNTSEEEGLFRSLIRDLRSKIHPSQCLWTSLVRRSLRSQSLWPVDGGLSSAEMQRLEEEEAKEEERIMQKMKKLETMLDSPASPTTGGEETQEKKEGVDEAESTTPAPTPLPALLLATHTVPVLNDDADSDAPISECSLRLYDATNPFQLDLLAMLPLSSRADVWSPNQFITSVSMDVRRREVVIGSNKGEIVVLRLEEFKPQPQPQPTPPQPTSTSPNQPAQAAEATAQKASPAAGPSSSSTSPTQASAAPTSGAASTSSVTSPPTSPSQPKPQSSTPQQQSTAATTSPTSPSSNTKQAQPPPSSQPAAPSTPATTSPAVPPQPQHLAFNLVHRCKLFESDAPIQLILLSPPSPPSVSTVNSPKTTTSTSINGKDNRKYFICDEKGNFAFLRTDGWVAVKQALPNNLCISTAHFSPESLIKPKNGSPPCVSYLYLCAVDGSIHVFSSELEAPLQVIQSLVSASSSAAGSESGASKSKGNNVKDRIQWMESVRVLGEHQVVVRSTNAAVMTATSPSSPSSKQSDTESADAGASASYILACTSQSIKLLAAAPSIAPTSPGGSANNGSGNRGNDNNNSALAQLNSKHAQVLLSLRAPEKIRLAFLVHSPHLIEKRLDEDATPVAQARSESGSTTATSGGNGPAAAAVAVAAPPARELCLAIVDATAMLHVYSVNLKRLFSKQLNIDPSFLSSRTFTCSSDGRLAFLSSSSSCVLAQLFPNKHYGYRLPPPPPRLWHPLVEIVRREMPRDNASSTNSNVGQATTTASGWFSTLLPMAAAATISHESLFDQPMPMPEAEEEEEEEVVHAVAKGKSASVAATSTSTSDARAQLDAERARRYGGGAAGSSSSASASASSSSTSNTSQAQSAVASAQQTMSQNQALAAANLRRTEEVADKSEVMAEHANDFLAAARKLKQQQKSSWW